MAETRTVNDPEPPPVGVQEPVTVLPLLLEVQPVTLDVSITEVPVTTSGPGTVSPVVITVSGLPAPKLTIRLNVMLSP